MVGVGRLIGDQRFRSGVGEVADLVGLAQDAMLVYGAEVDCSMESTSKGLQIVLTADKELPATIATYFDTTHTVEGIHSIGWLDGTGTRSEKVVTLHLWAPGTAMSRGLLFLAPDVRVDLQGTRWRSIALAGYPAPIALGRHRTLDHLPARPQDDAEELYPHEIVEEKA